jgi:hypothetical protein
MSSLPFDPTAPKALPKPGPRQPLSKFDFATKFLEQGGRCYLCSEKLVRGQIIDEHDPPRETMPAEICDELRFRKLACKACAKAKTVDDQAVIAKGRRQRREKGQQARRAKNGPQITSRGFQKRPDGVKHQWAKRKFETRKS